MGYCCFRCSISKSRPNLCDCLKCSTPGSLSSIKSQRWFTFTSVELVMLSDHFNFCHPLLFFPLIFSSIKVFSSESVLLIRWLKYWSFCFSISPPNKYSGLISFRTDWLELLAVPGTLKNLLQHHRILQHSTFFMVQLSHLYMTTEKNHSFGYMNLCQQSDVSAH